MTKFKEIPRQYDAAEVDSEIAILTQSKNFYKKECEKLREELDKLENEKRKT